VDAAAVVLCERNWRDRCIWMLYQIYRPAGSHAFSRGSAASSTKACLSLISQRTIEIAQHGSGFRRKTVLGKDVNHTRSPKGTAELFLSDTVGCQEFR